MGMTTVGMENQSVGKEWKNIFTSLNMVTKTQGIS